LNDNRDEDEQLRSVALRNAGAILLARQRAEEELVRTKEALWKQSELLRVTLASIGDAVVTTDNSGNVQSLNAVAEGLTGWTQREAVGRPLSEVFRIVDEKHRQPVEDPAARALREGGIVGLANHTILIARDGTETPIDDSAAPIRDEQGRIHGAVLIFRSIAHRVEADRLLRENARELADFFENATVGMHWVGPDGTILRANQAELDLLGYAREEYVGHSITEFHADAEVIEDILCRLAAGETLRDREARMRCKDGSIKRVLIDSSVLFRDSRFVHTRCFTRDISDRQRAEEARGQLAAIVESSQDAIISKTLEGRIVSWNSGAEQLFGYGANEAVGQSIMLLIPPERQDEERTILERLRRGERIEHYETVRMTKGGRRIDVSLTISPIRNAAGNVVGASKISRDITARKRAERRLATQDLVTRALAESTGLDAAAPRILQAMCEHLRWEVGALWLVDEGARSLRCAQIYRLPSAQVAKFEAVTREISFGPGRGLPGRIWSSAEPAWIGDITADGNFTRAAVAASDGLRGAFGFPIVLNEKVFGVMEFFSGEIRQPDSDLLEMTAAIGSQIGQYLERRRAEAALRTSEARKTAILDTALDSIITCDREGRALEFNPAAEKMFGFHRDEVLGRDMAEIFIPVHLRERHRLGMAKYLATGEGPILNRRIEMPALHADGHEFPVELAVIRIPGQEPPLFTAYVRDITERKRAEQALREADSRKDEFLAMLAHELRNPLAPIRHAIQIIRGRSVAASELQWATEVIDRQVQQMSRLVDDLLDVSRITRGKVELRKERVELDKVLSSAIEANRPLIEKWGHTLSVKLPPETILLDADPTRLAQVFLNLLNNAAKYTDRGGHLALVAERQGSEVLVRVRDDGIGIPAEMLPRVFDLFAQADRALDRDETGLGIGLTLVQRLLEMHGGTVEAHSEGEGKGSEFTVRLPVAAQRVDELGAGANASADPASRAGHRVLVVDDNRDAADSLGMLLRMMGNEVRTVYDGLEAVAAAQAFRPDVVLLDLGLPKMDGYEVARRIRDDERGKHVLIVALTGWGQEEDRRRSKGAGFDHHMTKPIDFDDLGKLLS
jgi:PAS domain S-box-containing protein